MRGKLNPPERKRGIEKKREKKEGQKKMRKEKMLKGKMIVSAMILGMLALSGCSASNDDAAQAGSAGSQSGTEAPQNSGNADGAESSRGASADTSGKPTELLLAAAASMKPVMDEVLIPEFTKQHPEYQVTATYDSSGKLQTQIEQGLDADLFLSAATKQMDALNGEGLINPDTITMLLENQIVLIVPKGSEDGYKTFEDIQKAPVIAIGDPDSVPAGQYAKEALEHLGLYDTLKSRCSLGTNVTEVLNWVAEKSADAGIVYATDAATTDRVTVIAPAPKGSLAKKVLYPIAVLKSSKHPEGSSLFLEFLKSADASKAFSSYGFTPQAK